MKRLKKKQIVKSLQKPGEEIIDTSLKNPEQKTKTEPKYVNIADNTWEKLINEMELVGLVNELARNCVLKFQDEDKIELLLTPSCKFLLNKKINERLEEAIKKKLGPEVKLIIKIGESDSESPSETNTRAKEELKNSAKEAVKNDSDLKSLLDTFDATIDQDSIQPQ